jgi:hypothetical protein
MKNNFLLQIRQSRFFKAFFILMLLVITQLDAVAGWKRAMLRFRDQSGRTISVSVDGRRYNKLGRTVTVGDLPAGRHLIKVFRYNSNGHGYTNGILMYSGSIMVQPSRIYYCTVFRDKLDIEENCCIDDYGQWNQNDNWDDWDQEHDCWNNNRKWDRDNNHHQFNDRNNNHDWSNRNDNDKWNNHNNGYGDNRQNDNFESETWNSYEGNLSHGRHQQILDQMRQTSFENSKVNLANAALKNNKFTTRQLVDMLNEFSFESTKLKFAKDNYRKLLDKQNFFMVNDVFTFQSSKDEINEFISKQ